MVTPMNVFLSQSGHGVYEWFAEWFDESPRCDFLDELYPMKDELSEAHVVFMIEMHRVLQPPLTVTVKRIAPFLLDDRISVWTSAERCLKSYPKAALKRVENAEFATIMEIYAKRHGWTLWQQLRLSLIERIRSRRL